MNRRIAKKRAALISARVLSIPLTLAHARPSLFALPLGTRRYYVYRQSLDLGLVRRIAHRATWQHFASRPTQEGAP